MFLLPDGSKIHSMTIKSSKTLMNKYGNWKKFLDTEHKGWRKITGFQLRYIYLIDKSCKITVPLIPFSEIQKRGAGMYKGIKTSDSSITANAVSDQLTEEGQHHPIAQI